MFVFWLISVKPGHRELFFSHLFVQIDDINESTTGADASVEALKLYHMKLTLAYSSFTCSASNSSLPEYKKWEMIAVIVAKKVLNPQMGVPVCNDC